MGAVLKLESFDGQTDFRPEGQQDAPSTYEDGFREGQTAAMQAMEAEQNFLRKSVAEALIDGMFGYQEAKEHFANGMTGFVTSILEQVVPALLAPSLHMRVRQLLIEALERDASQPIIVQLPYDQIKAFEATIHDLDLTQIKIEADAALGNHAALVVGGNVETSIDLDALATAISDHTTVLTTPAKEVS